MFRLRVATWLGRMALVGMGVGVTADASASVVVAQSVEQMAAKANVVVDARVVGSRSEWDEAHRRIFTVTELEVVDVWSGDAPTRIQIRTLGGTVGDVAMRVSGGPVFHAGEEVVAFLAADHQQPSQFRVMGLSQGLFRVVQEGEERVAVSAMRGLARVEARPSDGRLTQQPSGSGDSMPLATLRARVKAAQVSTPQ